MHFELTRDVPMKGGQIHDDFILQAMLRAFLAVGAMVRLNAFSRSGRRAGFCDITGLFPDGRLIAVEIEMTSRRIANDVWKATELRANELWIVVPNRKLRIACQRRLQGLEPSTKVNVFVLTLPQAVQRLKDCFSGPL